MDGHALGLVGSVEASGQSVDISLCHAGIAEFLPPLRDHFPNLTNNLARLVWPQKEAAAL